MSLPVSCWLAEVDGFLCVASRSTDYSEPRYVVTYWKTALSAYEFCRNHEMTAADLRHGFTVYEAIPGCFSIRRRDGLSLRSIYLDVEGGGKARAVKVEFEPVPLPRVGKRTRYEWMSGHWWVVPPKGKPRHVYV